MAEHVAAVKDGKLDYSYTDSSKKQTQATGSNLGYDQFLSLLCAEMQYQDPLEPTSNTEYVAQLATFSQLEATLSMQQSQENSMANDLVGKHVILKVEDENTGATNYVDGKVDYVLYEDGKTLLSVNNGLYSIDTLDTVTDSDYYEAVTISKTFSNMVAQLPDVENITADYDKAISQIREMYDGMTNYQQKFVKADDLQTLQKYEERIAELKKAEENTKTDTDADTDNKTDSDTKTDTDTETKTEE